MPKSEIPVETLIEQLHGPDWTARCDAARLLGQSGDPRAVDALLPDLKDADWRVRRNAAQALGALRDDRAVEPLIQLLKDRTLTVRQRAVVALGRAKDTRALPALLEIFLANTRESYDAGKAIKKFGKKALPILAETFEKQPHQGLLMLLVEMKYAGAFELLIKALDTDQIMTQYKVIHELGKLGDRRAVPYLMERLPVSHPDIQGELVRALGALNASEAIPVMLDLLVDDELFGPRSNVYHAVTEAFQIFGNISGDIENAFLGNYPPMFNMAGAPINLPEVIGLLGNDLSQQLGKAIARMHSGFLTTELPAGPVGEAMGKSFEDMAWKLGVMFADANDAKQERATRLIELLASDSHLTRAAAALSLPWYMDERSVEPLMRLVHDPDETVRAAATWSAGALQKAIAYRKQSGL